MDHSKQAAALFNKFAVLYQSRQMDVSAYAPELDHFISLLPHSSKVLEIACGPGNITKYVLDKNQRIDILGIDLAPNMIELAKANCPTATFEVMDCRELNSLDTKFDGVIVGFCLPYLHKGEAHNLFRDIAALLNDGGLLYLSTIEGAYEGSGLKKGSTGDEVFMHYYELQDIEALFAAVGFDIISTRRTVVSTNPHADVDLLIVAKKQCS